MSDHQIKHVFTRVTCPKKLAACTDLLVQTAEANGMIPLTPDVELRWVQTDDSRLIPAVYKAGTEVRIHSKGNPFACSIMFEAEVMNSALASTITALKDQEAALDIKLDEHKQAWASANDFIEKSIREKMPM